MTDFRNKRILILTAILLFAGSLVSGCSNTFEGVGKDVEKAGEKIQETF